jgi:DUF1680 family protein
MCPPAPRATLVVDVARSPHARLGPVPVSAVSLDPAAFWGERLRVNAEVSLLHQWEQLEETGRLDNFRRVAGLVDRPHRAPVFNDTDLYKWLEAASWVLAQGPAPRLAALVDEGIALCEGAQHADGYLDTYYSLDRQGERWSNLRDNHELYCLGHLTQAAVAHHRATGSDRLLRVATRYADLVCQEFGPPGTKRRHGIDGHPEVEMALVELYRETGRRRYLEQAGYFVEARGHGLLEGGWFGRTYFQDHLPFRQLDRLAGHAVRALYYVCGVTDLYLETGDGSLLETLERLFARLAARQLYVTGGVGARHDGEAFGDDHELPNAQAYTETCAAIASVMWCHRMLAATGEARYADLLEWTLHNAVLPGWSLDGRAFLYVNPLQDDGGHRRQPWHHCACCPPNVGRTVAALPAYVYSTGRAGEDAVHVNLYAQGTARIALGGGREVGLAQRTRYPWDGEVLLDVDFAGPFALHLRIPSWCEPGAASLSVNDETVPVPLVPGTWAAVRRTWRAGDRVRLWLPMPVRFLESHPSVLENVGRVAIARGPLLYCLEGVDHPGADLRQLELSPRRGLAQEWRPGLLGGVVALHGPGAEVLPDAGWTDVLYRPAGAAGPAAAPGRRDVHLTAVPYYAWQNRAPGPVQVWVRRDG